MNKLSELSVNSATPKQISSEELLGDARRLIIVHAGEQYLLRVTKNGKLILTK